MLSWRLEALSDGERYCLVSLCSPEMEKKKKSLSRKRKGKKVVFLVLKPTELSSAVLGKAVYP